MLEHEREFTTARRARMGFQTMEDFGQVAPGAPDPFANRVKVPAFYTISILLSGFEGKGQGGQVQLRPEDFLLQRITFATTGDTPKYTSVALPGYSVHGRAVEVTWSDEFTQFLGEQPALVSALFGDSNGFLDIPRGILFEGSQTLSMKLTRIIWPDPETKPDVTRWDFVFHGLGLLPPGKYASGSL